MFTILCVVTIGINHGFFPQGLHSPSKETHQKSSSNHAEVTQGAGEARGKKITHLDSEAQREVSKESIQRRPRWN